MLEPNECGSVIGKENAQRPDEVHGEVADEIDTNENGGQDGIRKLAEVDDYADSGTLPESLEETEQARHLVMFHTTLFPLACGQWFGIRLETKQRLASGLYAY